MLTKIENIKMNALWLNLNKKGRSDILKKAGYNPNNYSSRVWDYLPTCVKNDLLYVHNRSRQNEHAV